MFIRSDGAGEVALWSLLPQHNSLGHVVIWLHRYTPSLLPSIPPLPPESGPGNAAPREDPSLLGLPLQLLQPPGHLPSCPQRRQRRQRRWRLLRHPPELQPPPPELRPACRAARWPPLPAPANHPARPHPLPPMAAVRPRPRHRRSHHWVCPLKMTTSASDCGAGKERRDRACPKGEGSFTVHDAQIRGGN